MNAELKIDFLLFQKSAGNSESDAEKCEKKAIELKLDEIKEDIKVTNMK